MTGHPEPLLCDNLEGQGVEGGRGHLNAYGRFMLRYGKTHHNIKKKKKKKLKKKEILLQLTMNYGGYLLIL